MLKIISFQKIWDHAPHNALTDLIRFKDGWYCTFREGNKHVLGANGCIRILYSRDLSHWTPVAFFSQEGIDLRDPKLSVTPENKLMLLAGGSQYTQRGKYLVFQSRVAFSNDGIKWSPFQLVLEPHQWLWRVTWHQGKAYGVAYRFSNPKRKKNEWIAELFESNNGVDYKLLSSWDIKGYPNEATLRFFDDGRMIALLRRDKRFDNHAWIGISAPPYKEWEWKPTRHYFGGPNFCFIDGVIWAAGRILMPNPYGYHEKTVLAKVEKDDIIPVLCLPSGGDTSYPGMVYHEGHLWLSYYSSHEGTTAIYLACIQL